MLCLSYCVVDCVAVEMKWIVDKYEHTLWFYCGTSAKDPGRVLRKSIFHLFSLLLVLLRRNLAIHCRLSFARFSCSCRQFTSSHPLAFTEDESKVRLLQLVDGKSIINERWHTEKHLTKPAEKRKTFPSAFDDGARSWGEFYFYSGCGALNNTQK